VTGSIAVPSEPSRPDEDSNQSWVSRLVAGVKHTFSSGSPRTQAAEAPQPEPVDDHTAAHVSVSHSLKTSTRVLKHRSRHAPHPEIRDAAHSSPPLSPAVRDALFQEFLRRYDIEKILPSNQRP
jgi:hypothetical protein